eukprot:jgi/Chlat1/9145/Chrsp97S08436
MLWGIPTRYGMMSAQFKSLIDATGRLWKECSLVGKPVGIFFCTSTQGGGQETTALTAVTQIAHHGMIFVPMGYTTPLLLNMDEIHGGSGYGAGSLTTPDGSVRIEGHMQQVVMLLDKGQTVPNFLFVLFVLCAVCGMLAGLLSVFVWDN